ncbi:MAG: hypothetical protein Q4C60_00935 [Eubacteriales bacterium]|nr:hypothetical protein [Eubacteriales bacterium]
MTLQEASSRFHLDMGDLRLCEKNELFSGSRNECGEMDYPEAELQRVIPFLFLLKAGMSMEKLKEFTAGQENGARSGEEQIRLLRRCRSRLLDDLHGKQQLLDQLDYLIYEKKKQG